MKFFQIKYSIVKSILVAYVPNTALNIANKEYTALVLIETLGLWVVSNQIK